MPQWYLVLALLLGSLNAQAVTDDFYQPGLHKVHLSVGGFDRTFFLATPHNVVPQEPLPLVFFFHGAGGTSLMAAKTYHWSEKGDAEHFFVIYPQGLPFQPHKMDSFIFNPNVWRDGRHGLGLDSEVNDLDFFTKMLAWTQDNLPINPHRLYVTGFSNGAGMTFTLGAKFSDRIAAIAPVASHCVIPIEKLTRPLPVFYLTGTEDPLNPLAGGPVRLPWGTTTSHPPTQESIDLWVRLNGCSPTPQILEQDQNDTVLRYAGDRADVFFTKVNGLGHHWPGTAEPLPRSISGPIVDPFSATDRIWNFFRQHTL